MALGVTDYRNTLTYPAAHREQRQEAGVTRVGLHKWLRVSWRHFALAVEERRGYGHLPQGVDGSEEDATIWLGVKTHC